MTTRPNEPIQPSNSSLAAAVFLMALLPMAYGCHPADDSAARCAELQAMVDRCYPEHSSPIICTPETLANAEVLLSLSCEELAGAGAYDWALTIGCTESQYVCYFVFCCNTQVYPVQWRARPADFEIVNEIQSFQARIPRDIQAALETDLARNPTAVASKTYSDTLYGQSMSVQKTQGIINIPYDLFSSRLPAHRWGPNLSDYMGGEIVVYSRDGSGRIVQQVERMVLATIQSNLRIGKPLDMTKVETIQYRTDGATVYWKVVRSDNRTVIADVGSVDFRAYGPSSTLVTFHSAHKLAGSLPGSVVRLYLKHYFSNVIGRYGELVRRRL